MSTSYTIIAQNNSSNATNIAVFQQDPHLTTEDVFTLAWFSKFSYPATTLTFQWDIQYDFVWSQTGELVPGVVFTASQTFPADLSTTNSITLDYQNNAYEFTNQGPSSAGGDGSLFIAETGSVPLDMAAVGVGMSGAGTFVVQAQPNQKLMFTPTPTYWIIAGTFQPGEVMSIEQITSAYEVQFPPGVTSMHATLNQDNTFTISTTQAVNAAVAMVARHRPTLLTSATAKR